jgi:GH35 family endo-1,4-beta-xylanase/alpha-L-arabinofuranosidase
MTSPGNIIRTSPLWISLLMMLAPIGFPLQAQPTSISIQTGRPLRDISPDLLGVFFEDLNYAADGGLYAELIQNRSFEYSPTEQPGWNPLSFWELQKRGGGTGAISVAEMRPIHENNPHYALLTVDNPGEGVGIANQGFDHIPVEAGETYIASFWAYQAFMGQMWGPGDQSQPMPVSIRLETTDGDLLAEAEMEVSGREWKQISAELTPARTINDAQLVLLAHAKGGICLDMVSLFPRKTFRNRPNGLRPDLAQAIADLQPKFIRFPGGCLVHGQGIHRYYDWKDSIGPIEERRGERNLWGYHQTKGFGYFEFFQFCEDIGAKPLPVVTAGVCCQHAGNSPNRGQEGLPLKEMPAYVQDVLDLVEWANGPATSEWGAKRAAAGHPEPFGLKYIGVGNEDAITPIFRERFRLIYDGLKEKHPEIVVIGTVGPFASGADYDEGWAFARELDLDMVDEHYYVSPQWFWENLNRYDHYDRSGPQVYVGEYAAHDRDRRRNSLRSAIAEAAGLTGFERNGDIVRFSSYAPLFGRRGHTQWHPDLIYFNGTDVFLTPNYYVQQLFGQNSGDAYYQTTVVPGSGPAKVAASTVRASETGDLIVKIVNGETDPTLMQITLQGLTDREWEATKTVLTGPSADAFNQDGEPQVIRPVESNMTLTAEFEYEAPANSLTVLRIQQTPALKDAFKDHFLVGTAINRSIVNGAGFRRSRDQVEQDIALVKEQFNQITAENDMKWANIHPREGAEGYNFGPADDFVEFGMDNDMMLVGHTLVWHSQTPRWVFAGNNPAPESEANSEGRRPGRGFGRSGFDGPRASREELLERMRDHIHTVVGRYKGKIKVWDVVNEALADGGPEILRNSPWLQIIGPDFIAKAFEYAHEADPDAILRYNDYGLENPQKRRKLISLIKSLQEQGVPVMAIGTQAHLNVSNNSFDMMDQALAEMATLGVPIHVTELDVNSALGGQRNTRADISQNADATQGGLVEEADRRLTETYEGIFRAFLKHSDAVEMITFWGPNDANSWRSRGRPLLFDGNSEPKPAFHAVIGLVK